MTKFLAYRLRDLPMLIGIAVTTFLIGYTTNRFFLSIGIRIPVVRCGVGFGVGILLLAGTRYWTAILVGAFLNRVLIGYSFFSSLSNGLGVSLGALFGCWLLSRDKKYDPSIPSLNDYFRLLLWAGVIGASVTAVVATISMLGGEVVRQSLPNMILKWWMSDTLGVIIITPLVLVWRYPPRHWLQMQHLAEAFIYFSLAFLIGQTVFLNWFHESLGSIARGYWLFLFVVWGAARLGPHSVALVLLMTMIQALNGAAQGVGFFGTDIAQTQLLNFWFYMVILSLVGMGLASTITSLIQSERKVRVLAQLDSLTGLANRRLLSDRIEQSIAIAKRNKSRFGIIFHDLDRFKPVNDNHGHDIGDGLLKEVAMRIRSCVREVDTVARVGGDEFVILLPSIEGTKDAIAAAEKIQQVLSQPFEINGLILNITTSLGIATYPDQGTNEKSLLVHADNAMYSAKQKGRNTIVVFSEDTPRVGRGD